MIGVHPRSHPRLGNPPPHCLQLCYYQAIEFAIEHKLQRVEAGAQGEHKIARGYLPTRTHSAHYFPTDQQFTRMVSQFLEQERQEMEFTLQMLRQEISPYKEGGNGGGSDGGGGASVS